MKTPFVDLRAQYQSVKHEIDTAMDAVIKSSSFIGGQYVKQFEAEFAAYCGAKYCVGVGNGTDAIYIVLRALGVGSGDEVITAANSFIATSEAITLTGARVVFVDCDPQTYNIDCKKMAAGITRRTKAIVPVHLYGQPADMKTLNEIARKNNIFIVEDAAQAHGAEYAGRRVGTFGNAACFSFYPGKNLGAYGDGGAIVTNDESLADRCRMIANHGRLKKYDHEFEGVNSRLDGLQAAILSVKLKFLNEWTEKRRKAASLYRGLLADTDVITPTEVSNMRHVYHLFVIRLRNRDEIQAKLKERGISTGIHYPVALPNLTAYRYLGYNRTDFPIASTYEGEILSLPIFAEMADEQIKYVCDNIKRLI